MDKKELTVSSVMPKDLSEISAFLRMGKSVICIKYTKKGIIFLSSATKFSAKNGEWVPLKKNSSVQETATHQD